MTHPWYTAPWHRESYDRFVEAGLPELISSRLPLQAWSVAPATGRVRRVSLTIGNGGGIGHLEADLPEPDADGIFEIGGRRFVVVPVASTEHLERAEIRCVGEQFRDFLEPRLGEAPPGMNWDDAAVRTWLPFEAWMRDFFGLGAGPGVRVNVLDDTNWLARAEHLRRIVITDRVKVITGSQVGRTDPFSTPEGPNIGKMLSVARGATIRDGRIVVVDDAPAAGLSVTSSMIPLVEHDDPNRTLMGANMTRQWLVLPDPEPALVRTGSEPDVDRFWCGRNLLTAYVSWGLDTFEDAIVISESGARKLFTDAAIEPGDKLSNRHGGKGVISRILPDDEMPHLADGTPVELVYSFLGLQTRMNFGQVRESVLGRIAKAEGKPVVAPAFAGPKAREIKGRLKAAGLPESGMEVLTMGKNGPALARPSTAGWVYWGVTHHQVRGKIHATTGKDRAQRQGDESMMLASMGAFETILEHFNTCACERKGSGSLAAQVARGPVEQAEPPTPSFADLERRLAAAGIRAAYEGGRVGFSLAAPQGTRLTLACPVRHPWLHDRDLTEVGAVPDLAEYRALAEANAQLERVLASHAPESLTSRSRQSLARCVRSLFGELVTPDHVRLNASTAFSGRSVIAPGRDLQPDQLGLPDEIAWTLFGPAVTRDLGQADEVANRTEKAAAKLDEVMAGSWVVLERAPAVMPTAFLAFHPVRVPGRAIRVHPLICMAINGDFDGDMVAVFLPLTEAGQREAGEVLSIAGHVRRDPALLQWFRPVQEMVWGLADLGRTPGGKDKIDAAAGIPVPVAAGLVTRDTILEALRGVLARDGIGKTLEAMDRLMRLGFEATKASGASINPFLGSSLPPLAEPETTDPVEWMRYGDEIMERLASLTAYDDPDLGPQLLAVRTGARGNMRQLHRLTGPCVLEDYDGQLVIVRSTFRDGYTGPDMFITVRGAREGLAKVVNDFDLMRAAYGVRKPSPPGGFNVFARAIRAAEPGLVFARAAANGESDPLTDPDARLFVGLKP